MGLVKTDTESGGYASSIQLYSHAPDVDELKCIHCGEIFRSGINEKGVSGKAVFRLRVHMRNCPKRRLLRFVLLGDDVVFVLLMRPSKVTLAAIGRLFPEQGVPEASDLMQAIGVMKFLMSSGRIFKYLLFQPKNSPGLIELKNGLLPYSRIWKAMSPEDKKSFSDFCERVYARRQIEAKDDEDFDNEI